jgi:hypothetical protein
LRARASLGSQATVFSNVQPGQVAEWLKAPVSKTGVPERVS